MFVRLMSVARRYPVSFLIASSLIFAGEVFAGPELLIRAVIDGRESSLYEKVVVTSGTASISSTPGGPGEPIEPFAIFFKLKGDDGQNEQNGFVRVGSSKGEPIGWIKKKDTTDWNTRFILEPIRPLPDRTFSVDLGDGTRAELKNVPSGKNRFALISSSVGAPSDEAETQFNVAVYAGTVQQAGTGGTIARERNEVRDIKLEIVFVIENTDFMKNTFDGVNVFDSVKKIAADAVAAVNGNPKINGAVRLGIVEYQDASKEASYVSRVKLPLTDNLSKFEATLNSLTPQAIGGDWPDDVLAGLNTAVEASGWSENSVKHIILFGSSSCQLSKQGEGSDHIGGRWNSIVIHLNDNVLNKDKGYNTTGLTIRQLIGRANPQAGSVEQKARSAKLFHTLLVGKPEEELSDDVEASVDKIIRMNDDALGDWLSGDEKRGDLFKLIARYQLIKHQRSLAEGQYREIALNDQIPGMFIKAEPNAESMNAASQKLTKTLVDSFQTLGGVREGMIDQSQLEQGQSNEISQTFYAIVGAAVDKFKDLPVVIGKAGTRDDRGREVATKKVVISRNELERLKSTLDAIHKKFEARIAKAERQDVTQILDDLKQLTVQTTSGQESFAADVQLKQAITDLPLRTTALETTPRDIAVMPSDAFKQWLNKLESAKFRAHDLLNGKADWYELSSKAANDKFTFLHLSELP